MSDSAAYFAGRALGRHKLAPRVSPAKTVEGSIGGLVGSVGAAVASKYIFFPELPIPDAVVLGAVMGAIGQIGDLCESLLKRGSDVKDAASILPGHGGFLDRLEREEILPAVPPVPGTSLDEYQALVMRRFANPQVGDTIPRLCLDGSNRQPKFIIPTIADRLAQGLAVDGLALESALWCRYCAGTTDSGAATPANDPNWDRLTAAAQAARYDPAAWLGMTYIYGATGTDPRLAGPFARWLAMLWADGTAATLRRYLGP